MAFVMKEGKMASNTLDSMLTNGVSDSLAIKDGDLVVLGDIVANDLYTTNEYDTYKAAYPTAPTTDEVAIVDYAGISEGPIVGNVYKIGNKLFNLTVPTGTKFRVRRLALHDKYWLGEDNFATAPTVGQYAIATNGSGVHTPNASIADSGYCVKILASKGFTAGMTTDSKQIYLCEVVKLA